jgi:mono/diheme cytochrome c family protein
MGEGVFETVKIMLKRSGQLLALFVGYVLTMGAATATSLSTTDPLLVVKGEYIAKAAGCFTCHTARKQKGKSFAGGRPLRTFYGTFYTPNITPDMDTGIGSWSEADFTRALREGIRPDGDQLYPVFPYTAYTKLSDDDVHALWAYLRSVTAVKQANKPHELQWYAPPRFMVWFWKMLYFTPGRYRENPQKSLRWNRGAYLVEAVAHCSECHTPRNILGGKDSSLRFAGARNEEEDFVAPNITPDKKTGISDWSKGDLVTYFQTGLTPDGDSAGSVMADVIDDGLSHLRKGDLQAIADYVRTLPPIEHAMRKAAKKTESKKEEWE